MVAQTLNGPFVPVQPISAIHSPVPKLSRNVLDHLRKPDRDGERELFKTPFPEGRFWYCLIILFLRVLGQWDWTPHPGPLFSKLIGRPYLSFLRFPPEQDKLPLLVIVVTPGVPFVACSGPAREQPSPYHPLPLQDR